MCLLEIGFRIIDMILAEMIVKSKLFIINAIINYHVFNNILKKVEKKIYKNYY